MRDSTKVFHEGLRVQLAAKLFCLEIFMVYGGYLVGDWLSFALSVMKSGMKGVYHYEFT